MFNWTRLWPAVLLHKGPWTFVSNAWKFVWITNDLTTQPVTLSALNLASNLHLIDGLPVDSWSLLAPLHCFSFIQYYDIQSMSLSYCTFFTHAIMLCSCSSLDCSCSCEKLHWRHSEFALINLLLICTCNASYDWRRTWASKRRLNAFSDPQTQTSILQLELKGFADWNQTSVHSKWKWKNGPLDDNFLLQGIKEVCVCVLLTWLFQWVGF